MPQQPVYLDENGNPIGPIYLDENGNPIPPEKSTLKKAWEFASEPTIDYPSKVARDFSQWITEPELDESRLAAMSKGFVGGAAEGLGDVISGLTSPLNLAFTIAGLGGLSKAPAIAKASNIALKALSAPVVAEGAYRTATGEGATEKMLGVAEVAAGVAGGIPTKRAPTSPKVSSQLVEDMLRAQRFLNKPRPEIRGLLPEQTETTPPIPTNLRDITIPTEGIIPEPKTPTWIGGPSGGEGMVIPPSIEPSPRLLSRVAGQLFPEEATPSGTALNLDELREANRLRSIFYGPGEQSGLGSLQVPDRPAVNIPPLAGETSLGFNPRTQAELPYPLNVVPERLYPRAAQTEIARATPEAIREPTETPLVSQEVFLDASLPGEPKPISRGFVEKTEAYSGEGTARPGEPQLPSAPPKPSRKITPAVEAKEVISEIKKSPEPTVRAIAFKEPVKQEFKSRMTSKALDIGKRVGRGFQKSKWNWEAAETTLSKQGPAGKQIYYKLAEWSRDEHQLATRWESRAAKTVGRLSTKEYYEFMNLADSGVYTSSNPKIQGALDAIRQNEKEIFEFVNSLGIKIPGTSRVVKPLAGYTPRIYPEGFWQDATLLSQALREKFPNMKDETIEQIVKRRTAGLEDQLMEELGVSRDVAETIVHLGKLKSEKKIPSQYVRRLNLPGYRTDPLIWSEHYADWAKKIARTKHFGVKDVGDPFSPISMLIEQTRNPKLTKQILNVILGRRDYSPHAAFYQKVNRAANGFAARAYLSMFYISNVANNITIPLRMNFRALVYGIKEAALHPQAAREFASESGALYGVTRTLIEESYKRRSIIDPLRYYGMTASENMNRIISSGAGKYYAEQLFGKLKKNGKLDKYHYEQLYDLTLTDPNILLTQSKLTNKQLHTAGFRGAELTQGLGEGRKVPPGWNNPNPVIQIPLVFKRYAFQQTKIIKDALFGPNVPKAVRAKNFAYLVAISQPLGYALGGTKATIRGAVRGLAEGDVAGGIETELENRTDPSRRMVATFLGKEFAQDDELVTRMVDNLVNAWALGMFADIMYIAGGDARDFFFDVAGPAMGPPAELAFSAVRGALPGGDFTQFYRGATRMIPFVGPGLQRAFFPTKFQK